MDTRTRASRIKLIAFDIDGVMTDGGLHYTDVGHELKTFNVQDGLGLKEPPPRSVDPATQVVGTDPPQGTGVSRAS